MEPVAEHLQVIRLAGFLGRQALLPLLGDHGYHVLAGEVGVGFLDPRVRFVHVQRIGRVLAFLDGIDRADRRKGLWLGIAAAIAFNILLVLAGVVVWMWWAGHL